MPTDTFSAETRDGRLYLRFAGPLDRETAAARWDEAHRAARGAHAVTLDAGEVTSLDSGGTALLVSLASQEAEWIEPRDATARGTLDRFRKGLGNTKPPVPHHHRFRPISALGAYTLDRYQKFLERAGFMGETILTTVGLLPRPWRLRWAEVMRHLDEAGTQAFPFASCSAR